VQIMYVIFRVWIFSAIWACFTNLSLY
jgi:hypothetical protein